MQNRFHGAPRVSRAPVQGWILLALLLGCSACERAGDAPPAPRAPVAIAADDECHVCGMIIARFPGPKGQAYVERREQPLKFCSTRDLFGWLLQPETAAVVQEVYVHDMAQTDWAHPEDTRLVDARSAWYVIGSARSGAMGPALASFAAREDAERFAGEYGGRAIRFEDVTLELLGALISSP